MIDINSLPESLRSVQFIHDLRAKMVIGPDRKIQIFVGLISS